MNLRDKEDHLLFTWYVNYDLYNTSNGRELAGKAWVIGLFVADVDVLWWEHTGLLHKQLLR